MSFSAGLRFGTLAIPFTPLCQCILEETLKAVGPFYRVSMAMPTRAGQEYFVLKYICT